MDEEYEEFLKWFKDNELQFQHAQYDEESIAYSAWLERGRRSKKESPIVEVKKQETYQCVRLSKFRTRKVFSLLPFIIVDGFVWTGKWFTFVEIAEQLVKERYLDFDDGWSYQPFWTEWEENWKFVKINK